MGSYLAFRRRFRGGGPADGLGNIPLHLPYIVSPHRQTLRPRNLNTTLNGKFLCNGELFAVVATGVYRKPKTGRSGDEGFQGSCLRLGFLSAETGDRLAHL